MGPLTCINVSKSDRKNQGRIIANVGQKLDYPRSTSLNEEDLLGLVAVPMKKKQAKAFNFVFFQENVKEAKFFNLGEEIKIDGKLREIYVEDKEDEDINEEEIFVLTFIPNHIIAPYGKTLPEGTIEEAKDNILALAPNNISQPLYEAWYLLAENDFQSFLIMDKDRKSKRRGIKPSDVKGVGLEKYALLDSLIVETSRSSITSKDENVLSKKIKVSKKLAIQNFKDKHKKVFNSLLRSNKLGNPKPTETPEEIVMQDNNDNDDSDDSDREL